jgi:hypothetical protein
MTEVLVEYDTILTSREGRWAPRACTRLANDGLWEGWIEFLPIGTVGAQEAIRSGRETEQPNRAGVLYWAEGLTQVYLEGALARATAMPVTIIERETTPPRFDGPREPVRRIKAADWRRPVLDPFAVYQQGEDVLVKQLAALDASRLRDIAVSYGFESAPKAQGANAAELTRVIVRGVRSPSASVADRAARSRTPTSESSA